MHHVDEVWGRLHFRTPWSADREHDRIEVALTRFLDWHAADKRDACRDRGAVRDRGSARRR